MPRVKVSAQLIETPRTCACCGGSSNVEMAESATKTKGKRVIQEETKSHNFRLCGQCYQHLRLITPKGQRTELAMPGAWRTFRDSATEEQMRQYIALRSHRCEAADVVADFETWDGSVKSFRFDSRSYAAKFAAENRRAGRNVVLEDYEADPPEEQPLVPPPPPPPTPSSSYAPPPVPQSPWAHLEAALAAAAPPPPVALPAPPRVYPVARPLFSFLRLLAVLVVGGCVIIMLAAMLAFRGSSQESRAPASVVQPPMAPGAATAVVAAPVDAGTRRRSHRSRRRSTEAVDSGKPDDPSEP